MSTSASLANMVTSLVMDERFFPNFETCWNNWVEKFNNNLKILHPVFALNFTLLYPGGGSGSLSPTGVV